MLYTKDGKNYSTPIKLIVDNKIIFTNDESKILEAGYTIYEPPAPITQTLEQKIKSMRFSKLKVKQKLVELNLWQTLKDSMSENEYEDLMIADDFAFDNELFVKFYNTLKEQIDDIDNLLLDCEKSNL